MMATDPDVPTMKRQRNEEQSAVTPPIIQHHGAGAVRFAEKRRTGTCRFADRVATASLDCFRTHIPASFRDTQKQTCVAAIVAHFRSNGHLQVLSLGVGTKFLPESILEQELIPKNDDGSSEEDDSTIVDTDGNSYWSQSYGLRVRDCHAEVLTRRAFQLQLFLEMKGSRSSAMSSSQHVRSILEPIPGDDTKFRLNPDVTLHMYSSSTPCGNATLKKFTSMKRESFDDGMDPNEWPSTEHEVIGGHSLKLGQFSLLLKKDRTITDKSFRRTPIQTAWPSNQNDSWCPPGTTIVWSKQGSIHTCSDKICRWNILGLQGSLLASLLESALYMDTMTVGRKFTECICRRAVCCRATEMKKKKRKAKGCSEKIESQSAATDVIPQPQSKFSLHHPAIMGTSVYMDDIGTLRMSEESEFGQDVRFNSPLCYSWCPTLGDDIECIDGLSGFALHNDKLYVSRISTASMLRMHASFRGDSVHLPTSLGSIHTFKEQASPEYESAKEALLLKHKMFRGWRRRGSVINRKC